MNRGVTYTLLFKIIGVYSVLSETAWKRKRSLTCKYGLTYIFAVLHVFNCAARILHPQMVETILIQTSQEMTMRNFENKSK